MEITETRTVTREITIGHICDVCKERLPRVSPYEVREVEITAEAGTRYPEGGQTTRTRLDCCWSCWETKLRPAMEAVGAEFREEAQDY